jgi:hypothetical protein
MADERLKAWLRQARADLEAGRSESGQECHRRYWLQQSCEKCIKALGLLMWAGPAADEGAFRTHFLHRHSPLKQLAAEISKSPALPKSLRLLLRQIETELTQLDGEGLLRKVDGTTPTTDPTDVSYRYPFRDSAGKDVAPRDWTSTEWDAYQGNATGVAAAVERFLRALDNRRQRWRGSA